MAVKIEEGSNASRRIKMSLDNINEWCFEKEVTKIGRKYITVRMNKWTEEQFEIEEDYRQKYSAGGANYKLYLSREDVIEERKANSFYSDIKFKFSGYNNDNEFTLDQLQRIIDITNENKSK